uniref:CSON009736 protein n=1 Tax=Culicoides sonorensis TaxID=179676 RepID=A0A336LXM5_CULSO
MTDNAKSNHKRNKRKQKFETITQSLEDEIEFDVQLPKNTVEQNEKEKKLTESKLTENEKAKKKRLYEEPQTHPIKLKMTEIDIFKEIYNEMDDDELNDAWNGLTRCEQAVWKRKAFDFNTKSKIDHYFKPNFVPNSENDDLDLPSRFPDAFAESKKLLVKFTKELSEENTIRYLFGSTLMESLLNANKFSEIEKTFFSSIYYSDTKLDMNSILKQFYDIKKQMIGDSLKVRQMKSVEQIVNSSTDQLDYKIDDFVYVLNDSGPDKKMVRIKEMYLKGKVIVGRLFVTPSNDEMEFISPIYKNNVLMMYDGKEFKFSSDNIIGKCIVLNFSDYISARPTDIPEEDVYFCTHIKTNKYLHNPLVIEELTNVLETYPGEVYYFQFDGTEELVHDNQVQCDFITNDILPIKQEEIVIKPEINLNDDDEILTSQYEENYDNNENESNTTTPEERHEIILYDDSKKIIDLADTEDFVFVVDNSNSLISNEPVFPEEIEEGEILDIDSEVITEEIIKIDPDVIKEEIIEIE